MQVSRYEWMVQCCIYAVASGLVLSAHILDKVNRNLGHEVREFPVLRQHSRQLLLEDVK